MAPPGKGVVEGKGMRSVEEVVSASQLAVMINQQDSQPGNNNSFSERQGKCPPPPGAWCIRHSGRPRHQTGSQSVKEMVGEMLCGYVTKLMGGCSGGRSRGRK